MSDLYEVLQVHPSAEPEVIEAAYRRLARKYHPDVNNSPDAAARMASINSAYSVLANPQRRATYDLRMRSRTRTPPTGSRSSGPPASVSVPPPPPPVLPHSARSAVQRLPDRWLGALIAGMAPVSLVCIALFRNYAAGIIGGNRLWLNLFLLPAILVAAGLKVALGRGRQAPNWSRFGAACLTAGIAANLYTWLMYWASGPNGPAFWPYWSGLLIVVLFGYAGSRLAWDRLARSARRLGSVRSGRHRGGVRQ